MRQKQILLLALVIACLTACSQPPGPTALATPRLLPPTPASVVGPPHLTLEGSAKLPMNCQVRDGFISREVLYFTSSDYNAAGEPCNGPVVGAINFKSQKELWHIERDPPMPIAGDGERVFLRTPQGIEAVPARDGSTIWQTPLKTEGTQFDELLAQDGWLFYTTYPGPDSMIYALRAETGTIIWSKRFEPPIDWSKPGTTPWPHWNDYLAVEYDRGRLYARVMVDISRNDKWHFKWLALDARNGEVLWEFPFDTITIDGEFPPGGSSQLALGERNLYFSALGDTTYAVERDKGTVIWKRHLYLDRPIHINDRIIAISGYDTVGAIDAATGDLQWTIPFMDRGIGGSVSTLIPFNGYLIFYAGAEGTGQLSVVDLVSGKRVRALQPDFPIECSTYPMAFALYEDHLYLATLNCISSFQLSQ